jgi:hypothetical protein
MSTRWLNILLSLALAPAAAAQSFNVDFGAPGTGPAPTYAAAGIPGVWNSINVPHTTPSTGPQALDFMLTDVDGNLTGVGLHQFGGTAMLVDPDLSLAGAPDAMNLLQDGLMAHSVPLKTCLYFNGLENGTYEVTTYAWRPNNPAVLARSFIDFTIGDFLSGGSWTGSHVLGVTYVRHTVEVTTGFMGPHSGLPNGGNPTIGAMMNGIQLRKIEQGAPSFCDDSDGSLASCPCSNPGSPDTGCDIQQGTGGVGLDVVNQENSPANRVTWNGTGFPPASTPTSIVIRATSLDGGSPIVFGDGLRCVGVPIVRLGAAFASGGTATHVHGHSPLAGTGDFYYQLWFRNTPVMFCDPAAAFNLSNGRILNW